jgi:hypothetical protein
MDLTGQMTPGEVEEAKRQMLGTAQQAAARPPVAQDVGHVL